MKKKSLPSRYEDKINKGKNYKDYLLKIYGEKQTKKILRDIKRHNYWGEEFYKNRPKQ